MLHREYLKNECISMQKGKCNMLGTHVLKWKAIQTDSSKQILTLLHSGSEKWNPTVRKENISVTSVSLTSNLF